MKYLLAFFVCCTCLFSFSVHAEDAATASVANLTLEDSLRAAYISNPSLRAARSELLSIGENLPQALSGWKPSVSSEVTVMSSDIDGSNFGGTAGSSGSTSKDVLLSIDQPIYRGGKTTAETAAARHAIAAQKELLRAEEQEVLRDTAQVYMNVVRDKALLELSRNNRDVIAKQREAAIDRFEVGELTRTDVSQAEARLADAEAGITTARGDLFSSYAAFEQMTGLAPNALVAPDIELQLPGNLQAVINTAELQNPRIVAAKNTHRAAEEDVDGEWAELLPEVGVFSSWNRTYDPQPGLIEEQTTRSIGVSATIPLYQAGSVRSRVRQAKHDANRRYLEILDVRRQVKQEAVANWETWMASKAEIRSRHAQVKAAEIAREGVHAETELGARTVLDALDADQELMDAKVALVTAERNEVVARFDLASTLGFLTPETLGFPEEKISLNSALEEQSRRFLNMDVDRVQKTD